MVCTIRSLEISFHVRRLIDWRDDDKTELLCVCVCVPMCIICIYMTRVRMMYVYYNL